MGGWAKLDEDGGRWFMIEARRGNARAEGVPNKILKVQSVRFIKVQLETDEVFGMNEPVTEDASGGIGSWRREWVVAGSGVCRRVGRGRGEWERG